MSAAPRGGWRIERRRAPAAALHAPWPPDPAASGRVAAACEVDGAPAVVLGSAQPTDAVDAEAAAARGVEVVRRASGGGAVLVAPGAQVWFEVWLPRGDALWDEDVIRSARWLGAVWCAVLEDLGVPALEVHHGRATSTRWSSLVCFAGTGPGEVCSGGRKIVGVSQRRTRHGARMSSMAPLWWDPAALVSLLALASDEAPRLERDVGDAAVGLRHALGGAPHLDDGALVRSVTDALVRTLPSTTR